MGEQLERYLLLILAGIIAASILPTAIQIYRHNREEIHARVRSRGRHGKDGPAAALPDETVEPG
jgi:hypothetical protein